MAAPEDLKKILGTVANLLEYPDVHPREHLLKMENIGIKMNPEIGENFGLFSKAISRLSLNEQQELFTRTFDLQMICYPYLGYHLFGESYKRGAFMAQLNERYRQNGFSPENELPDHLAVVLHFISDIDDEDESAIIIKDGILPALSKMREAFSENQNPYEFLLTALNQLLIFYLQKQSVSKSTAPA